MSEKGSPKKAQPKKAVLKKPAGKTTAKPAVESKDVKFPLLILGQAIKQVSMPKGSNYQAVAEKFNIGSYVLCVGPDQVDPYSQIVAGQTVVAMPRGKAGVN